MELAAQELNQLTKFLIFLKVFQFFTEDLRVGGNSSPSMLNTVQIYIEYHMLFTKQSKFFNFLKVDHRLAEERRLTAKFHSHICIRPAKEHQRECDAYESSKLSTF